jgi:hypothetical protein
MGTAMPREVVTMRSRSVVPFLALAGLAACGGSDPATVPNPYLGTLTITSAATTNTCVTTHTVRFTSGTVDTHTVTAVGGDCLSFTNADTVNHRPATIGTSACNELNASTLVAGATFTTVPLSGPKVCTWQDALNPPATGGGGGGGGGY